MTSGFFLSISGPGRYPHASNATINRAVTTPWGNPMSNVGDRSPAVLCVVGTLRRDHSAHIAFAEVSRVLAGLSRMAVGEPVHHLRAQPRHDSHPNTNKTTAHYQPPFAQGVL